MLLPTFFYTRSPPTQVSMKKTSSLFRVFFADCCESARLLGDDDDVDIDNDVVDDDVDDDEDVDNNMIYHPRIDVQDRSRSSILII